MPSNCCQPAGSGGDPGDEVVGDRVELDRVNVLGVEVQRGHDLVAGVFEHHTSCLDGPGLELRLRRWLASRLRDSGHRGYRG